MNTEKPEGKDSPIYKSIELAPLGQKIYDFCREFPAVVFNAPPDYQEDFQAEHAKLIVAASPESSSFLRRTGEFFYKNKLINDFFRRVEEGVFLMLLLMGKKGLVTVFAKVKGAVQGNDIPLEYWVDIQGTRGYRNHFGKRFILSNDIVAVAFAHGLRKENGSVIF